MHLFQDRDEVGKLNMERFTLCSVCYSYMRLCMSRLVELYIGPSYSLLISYGGVDRCVDSAGAGKPRGINYVCMTAVPFFSAARAGVTDRDVEGLSLMAFFADL